MLRGDVTKEVLISVITVCKDSEEFIEQCMESVVTRSSTTSSTVVIDGGSTDGTIQRLRRYEAHLSYWHTMPDRNLAHAFNRGVEHSSGEWLIFLNSDDFFADGTSLSRMSSHLIRHSKADVVFGRVEVVTREQRPQPMLRAGGPWRWSEFRRRDTIPHQAAFTNRRFFRRVGPFSEEFANADYEHYLRAARDLSAVFVPELVSRMRTRGMSRVHISRTLKQRRLAQERHEAFPAPWMAGALYWFYVARGVAGRRARRLLGRWR
ncbi:MAG: glycosyltransferase [Thermoleophilaceae bacterium]